jgi:hypothetical protein
MWSRVSISCFSVAAVISGCTGLISIMPPDRLGAALMLSGEDMVSDGTLAQQGVGPRRRWPKKIAEKVGHVATASFCRRPFSDQPEQLQCRRLRSHPSLLPLVWVLGRKSDNRVLAACSGSRLCDWQPDMAHRCSTVVLCSIFRPVDPASLGTKSSPAILTEPP